MYNLAIRKCTSPPLQVPRLKIFKFKFTTLPGIEPRTCWTRGRHATIWASAVSPTTRHLAPTGELNKDWIEAGDESLTATGDAENLQELQSETAIAPQPAIEPAPPVLCRSEQTRHRPAYLEDYSTWPFLKPERVNDMNWHLFDVQSHYLFFCFVYIVINLLYCKLLQLMLLCVK